jgi:hypothetical protein
VENRQNQRQKKAVGRFPHFPLEALKNIEKLSAGEPFGFATIDSITKLFAQHKHYTKVMNQLDTSSPTINRTSSLLITYLPHCTVLSMEHSSGVTLNRISEYHMNEQQQR